MAGMFKSVTIRSGTESFIRASASTPLAASSTVQCDCFCRNPQTRRRSTFESSTTSTFGICPSPVAKWTGPSGRTVIMDRLSRRFAAHSLTEWG